MTALVAIAVLTELLVRLGEGLWRLARPKQPPSPLATRLLTYAVGLLLAFLFHVDLFAGLGLTESLSFLPTLGMLLTGVTVGRGVHFVRTLWGVRQP